MAVGLMVRVKQSHSITSHVSSGKGGLGMFCNSEIACGSGSRNIVAAVLLQLFIEISLTI